MIEFFFLGVWFYLEFIFRSFEINLIEIRLRSENNRGWVHLCWNINHILLLKQSCSGLSLLLNVWGKWWINEIFLVNRGDRKLLWGIINWMRFKFIDVMKYLFFFRILNRLWETLDLFLLENWIYWLWLVIIWINSFHEGSNHRVLIIWAIF